MIKKVFPYISMFFILLSFAGCSGSGEEYISPAVQQSNNIMEALIIDDTETFKSYLCPKIHDTHPELDEEIREFFDFIEGDIISYDEPDPAPTGGSTTPKEGWVEKFFRTNIKNIKTSSGKTYTIDYYCNLIYNEHPELLGITSIRILTNDAEFDQETGYPPDQYRVIRIKN